MGLDECRGGRAGPTAAPWPPPPALPGRRVATAFSSPWAASCLLPPTPASCLQRLLLADHALPCVCPVSRWAGGALLHEKPLCGRPLLPPAPPTVLLARATALPDADVLPAPSAAPLLPTLQPGPRCSPPRGPMPHCCWQAWQFKSWRGSASGASTGKLAPAGSVTGISSVGCPCPQ